MLPPDPGPQGYVYKRSARSGTDQKPHKPSREDFVRSCIKKTWNYTPIGKRPRWHYFLNTEQDSEIPEPAAPPLPMLAPSPSSTAAPETVWEARGVLSSMEWRFARPRGPVARCRRRVGDFGQSVGATFCPCAQQLTYETGRSICASCTTNTHDSGIEACASCSTNGPRLKYHPPLRARMPLGVLDSDNRDTSTTMQRCGLSAQVDRFRSGRQHSCSDAGRNVLFPQ